MALYSNTLQVIRAYLSSAVGDLLYGVCGTTLADTTHTNAPFLWQADDYYNNNFYEVYVYAGTNIGVTKRVTDWDLSNLLLTVHSAYDVACDATSYIELHKIFTTEEYNKAINLAIEAIAENYLIDKIDETTVLAADTYEYTLPTTMSFIHKVTTEDTADSGDYYDEDEVDPRDWSLISPRKLKLRYGYYSITAGKDLRIEGQGRQALVSANTEVIYLPPDWIVQKAITFLPQNKIQSNNLADTYRNALLLSAREPRRWANPRSQKVIE